MKIVVCGSRHWNDAEMIRRRLQQIEHPENATILHGGADGADSIAAHAAFDLGFGRIHAFPAQWYLHGTAAGPIRNRLMLDEHPDLLIAFHDDPDLGRGTRDIVFEARRRGITVEVLSHHIPPATPRSTDGG